MHCFGKVYAQILSQSDFSTRKSHSNRPPFILFLLLLQLYCLIFFYTMHFVRTCINTVEDRGICRNMSDKVSTLVISIKLSLYLANGNVLKIYLYTKPTNK